ncbi:hypothetical protein BDV96DRAFT_601413 [Lophiotrema nucula]|uniref:Uncharacterized protein n=1 Tax=Lophiotrema nucula TaxID=690887 RepID=A0A6A5Z1B2_9PLEO|nr:hypothetical protein BDV96DRAFT_601413 [Lophiotrema nucula]
MGFKSALKRIAQLFTRYTPLQQVEDTTSACKELLRVILEDASPYSIAAVTPDGHRSVPDRYEYQGPNYRVARVEIAQICNNDIFPPKVNHPGLAGLSCPDAILFSQSCSFAVYYFWNLIVHNFLSGIIDKQATRWLELRVIPEFDSYIPSRLNNWQYRLTTHTIMVIKILSGQEFVLDITGIQFGFDELVVPLEEYKRKRAIPRSDEKWMNQSSNELEYWLRHTFPEPWVSLRGTVGREVLLEWLALGKPRFKSKVVRKLQGVVLREIQKKR